MIPSRSDQALPIYRQWSSTQAVRARIIDGAMQIFAELGYARTTIDDLVAATQASIGSLYHHFGDKEALFYAVLNHIREEMLLHVDDEDFEGSYLRSVWKHRAFFLILGAGTPASYNQRERYLANLQEWVGNGDPIDHMAMALLLEGTYLVAECTDEVLVEPIVIAVKRLIGVARMVGF